MYQPAHFVENRPEQIQRLIRERVPVDDWRLSDRDVPLEQLAPIESA